MNTDLEKTAQYWSNPVQQPARIRWWESPMIVSHINRRISGIASPGTADGDADLLKALNGEAPFARAVSVGCGSAAHEIHLLQTNVVQHFDLHEIAETRVAGIWKNAQKAGVTDRISVISDSPFVNPRADYYDLVYWKDALHHMYPSLDAVCWSRKVLKTNGMFFMNECVAPTYMQWTERQLDIVEKIRTMLPQRYLADPRHPGQLVTTRRIRPSIQTMRAGDPSECIDSGNILPSARAVFPNLNVIPTGGVVYMLALNDILANIREVEDDGLLAALMTMDDMYSDAGEYVYAVAHAKKIDPSASWGK